MSSQETGRPIVILGAARSGTKFLRGTLAVSQNVAATPYDLNFIWRTGNESWPSDAIPAEKYRARDAERIVQALRSAAGIRPGDSRRLLEKTVSNSLRVEYVSRILPNAQFVHIVRDGRNVVASSLRQWKRPPDLRYLARKLRTFPIRNYRYAYWYLKNRLTTGGNAGTEPIWGVRYPGIETDLARHSLPIICARQWLASISAVREAVERLSDIDLREVCYEELVSSTRPLEDLIRWIGLDDADRILDHYAQTLEPRPECAWRDGIPAEDRESVLNELAPVLSRLGYV